MNNFYIKSLISLAGAIVILFTTQSCNTNNSQKNIALIDSAETLFIQFDKMPNTEKLTNQALLDESISLLESVLKSEPNNPSANYFYGYALDRKLNGGVDVLNFELINLDMTKQISVPFEKLTNNPDFVPDYKLSQFSKITNVWGILALNYMIKGKPDSAEFAFKTGNKLGGFRAANLEYCRNIINTLEPNSVLFIDTDLETFCFWYLQFVEKLRPDVSIVNLALLDYQWYAKWINWSPNFSNVVSSNLTDQDLFNIYSLSNSPVTDSIITIKNHKSTIFPSIKSDLKITLNGRNRDKNGILVPINDKIALSIIESNIWVRPIYFSINVSKTLPYSLGIGKYIKLEGLAAKLYPEVVPVEKSVNGELCAKHILSDFKLAHLQNTESYTDRDIGFFSELYKFSFIQTLYYYADYATDKSQAKAVMNKYETVFPENTFKRSKEDIELLNKIRGL